MKYLVWARKEMGAEKVMDTAGKVVDSKAAALKLKKEWETGDDSLTKKGWKIYMREYK